MKIETLQSPPRKRLAVNEMPKWQPDIPPPVSLGEP